MIRPNFIAVGALSVAFLAGAAMASETSGDVAGRYALAVFQDADGGGGAFVTDTATGETMFCTPQECRRLAVRSAEPPAARAPTVRRGVPAPPPDLALPPPTPPVSGSVNPVFENF